jgi:hypothetical protein
MTGPKDTPPMDPSDGTAVPSVEDLDATDRLLDAIARGGLRATDPGIELLSLAAGPANDAEMAGGAGFVAAVADASRHRHMAAEHRPHRSISRVGRVLVAKAAVLASLLAVGVAGAGAVTGVIAYTAHQNPAPDRLLRPEVTTTKVDLGQRAPAGDDRDEPAPTTPTTPTAPTTRATTDNGATVPQPTTERLDGAVPQDDTTDRDLAEPGVAIMPTSAGPTTVDDDGAAGTTSPVNAPPVTRSRPSTSVARAPDTGIPWGVCAAGCSAPRATDPPTPAAASTSSRSSATSAPRTDASAPQPRGPR